MENKTFAPILIALLCLAAAASAYPLNVSGNVSLNLTDGNGTLAYPGGNYTFNTSANASFQTTFNLTILVLDVNATNASINLSRGETRNLNGSFENLTLYCTNETTTVYVASNGTVNVTGTIKRGQTFEQTNGACNVQVKCQGTCTEANSYEVNQTVTLTKVGNSFTVAGSGSTKTFSIDILNQSDSLTLSYVCPKDVEDLITRDNETQLAVAYDFCQAEFPYLNQWLNTTLNKCSDNWDAYRDFVQAHNSAVITANQDLSNALSRVASLETEKELANKRASELERQVLEERDRTSGREVMLSITSFIIICLIVALFIKHNGGEEVGA